MTEPKIITFDIERASALVEVWQLKQHGWIPPQSIIVPTRTICLAWKVYGEDETHFSAEWDPYDDGDPAYAVRSDRETYAGHGKMIEVAHKVFDEADYLVGWNSASFDVKNLKSHMIEYGLKPPSPHIDIDLIKVSRSNFGFMSHKLQEVAQRLGHEGKYQTGFGLWTKLRWSDGEELENARKLMRTYNIQDVIETEKIFDDFRPWIPRLNLYNDPDELICRKCKSTNLRWEGYRRAATRLYRRFQCKDCGGWGQSNHYDSATETSSA